MAEHPHHGRDSVQQPRRQDHPSQTEAETRVMRALGRMPYLVSAAFYSVNPEPEVLARTLEAFADFLGKHALEVRELEDRVKQAESDIAAVRRVFTMLTMPGLPESVQCALGELGEAQMKNGDAVYAGIARAVALLNGTVKP